MNIEQCKEEIKRHEGEVLEIYEDSLGFKTLGIGHLCQPEDPEYDWEVGTKVSQEVVDLYYEDDFNKHLAEAIHVFGTDEAFYNLPENIQHVIVNMCFNMGAPRLSGFKKFIGGVNAGDWKTAAVEMMDSRWARQVGDRAVRLKNRILTL